MKHIYDILKNIENDYSGDFKADARATMTAIFFWAIVGIMAYSMFQ